MCQSIYKNQLCPLAALLIQPEKEFGKRGFPACDLTVFHQGIICRDEHIQENRFSREWGNHLGEQLAKEANKEKIKISFDQPWNKPQGAAQALAKNGANSAFVHI